MAEPLQQRAYSPVEETQGETMKMEVVRVVQVEYLKPYLYGPYMDALRWVRMEWKTPDGRAVSGRYIQGDKKRDGYYHETVLAIEDPTDEDVRDIVNALVSRIPTTARYAVKIHVIPKRERRSVPPDYRKTEIQPEYSRPQKRHHPSRGRLGLGDEFGVIFCDEFYPHPDSAAAAGYIEKFDWHKNDYIEHYYGISKLGTKVWR